MRGVDASGYDVAIYPLCMSESYRPQQTDTPCDPALPSIDELRGEKRAEAAGMRTPEQADAERQKQEALKASERVQAAAGKVQETMTKTKMTELMADVDDMNSGRTPAEKEASEAQRQQARAERNAQLTEHLKGLSRADLKELGNTDRTLLRDALTEQNTDGSYDIVMRGNDAADLGIGAHHIFGPEAGTILVLDNHADGNGTGYKLGARGVGGHGLGYYTADGSYLPIRNGDKVWLNPNTEQLPAEAQTKQAELKQQADALKNNPPAALGSDAAMGMLGKLADGLGKLVGKNADGTPKSAAELEREYFGQETKEERAGTLRRTPEALTNPERKALLSRLEDPTQNPLVGETDPKGPAVQAYIEFAASRADLVSGSRAADFRKYAPVVAECMAKENIPLRFLPLVCAQINCESKWITNAYAGGREDSYGLMQINRNAHPNSPEGIKTDPVANIKYGINYLGKLYQNQAGGSIVAALDYYNGAGNFKRDEDDRYSAKVLNDTARWMPPAPASTGA